MTPEIIALVVLAGIGIYAAGHWHGAILTKAKAAALSLESKVKAAGPAIVAEAHSIEEALATEAESLLVKLGDKSGNLARIAQEQEAMARKDRLMAGLRAKLPA